MCAVQFLSLVSVFHSSIKNKLNILLACCSYGFQSKSDTLKHAAAILNVATERTILISPGSNLLSEHVEVFRLAGTIPVVIGSSPLEHESGIYSFISAQSCVQGHS